MSRWWMCLVAVSIVPAAANESQVRLAVRETVVLDYPGATAARADDASMVDAAVHDGRLTITGRRTGQTVVTVVQGGRVETLAISVEAFAPGPAAIDPTVGLSPRGAYLSTDTANYRFGAGMRADFSDGGRAVRLRIDALHDSPRWMDSERWLLPAASLELAGRSHSVVFLDQQVGQSPLTLDRTTLRGVHVRQGTLNAYSGLVAPSPWNRLPSGGDLRAHGASYRVESGGLRVVPTVVYLPDSGTPVPGVVSVGVERAAAGDPLRAKAEYGWSGKAGGSFEVDYRVAGRHLAFKGMNRPVGFAAVPTSRSPGSTLDGTWHENLGARTTASMTLSASRLELDGREPDAASGRIELRHRTTDRWSVNAGVGGSLFRDAGASGASEAADDAAEAAYATRAATELRRGTVSLGTAYDLGRLGLSATYRNEETSAASRGGHGGRVALRASHGGWRANLYADAQQQASTLELGLDDRPDLARAISDLGMVVASPDDAVRALRDHGALFAQHGVTVGALRLDPLRVQGGIDLAWRDTGARRTELGLRVALDEVQGYVGARRAVLGNLYASWRMFGDTDLTASYASWTTQRDLSPYDSRTVVRFGLRTAL